MYFCNGFQQREGDGKGLKRGEKKKKRKRKKTGVSNLFFPLMQTNFKKCTTLSLLQPSDVFKLHLKPSNLFIL